VKCDIFLILVIDKLSHMRNQNRYICLVLLLILFSCAPDSEEQPESNKGFAENQQNPAKEVYYRFPSASEMFTYIHKDQLTFKDGLVNPVVNAKHYQTTEAKLLNLGVYLADLTYFVVFEERQQAQVYLNTVRDLTEQLRIKPPNEEAFLRRMQQNVHRADSLAALADEFNNHVMDYLMATGREKYLAIITTGGYIEALYLAAHTLDENNVSSMSTRIAEQKFAVANLSGFVKTHKSHKTALSEELLTQLTGFFNELEIEENPTKVSRDAQGKLNLEGGHQIHITDEQTAEFKKQIEDIRYHVVHTK